MPPLDLARLAFDCWLFGSLFKTLAVLWTEHQRPRVLSHISSARLPEAVGAAGNRELLSHRKAPPFEFDLNSFHDFALFRGSAQ